jgi:hypothetical protein
VVDALLSNTTNEIFVTVFDKNTIDREKTFSNPRVNYNHIVWDKIGSPSERKGDAINRSQADYILELSDDSLVSEGWDEMLIKQVEEKSCVVSGRGKVSIFKDGHFFIGKKNIPQEPSQLTNCIDRNFIFSSQSIWKSVQYPYYLKYRGEEEVLGLDFFMAGYDIYSAPESTYEDLGLRNLDNLYVPFSKDHNYNMAVDKINNSVTNTSSRRSGKDFFDFHGIQEAMLKHLPYQTNDVVYDQYRLKFQDVDARKFISKTKSIY